MSRSRPLFVASLAAILVGSVAAGCHDPEIFDDLPDAVLGEAYDALLHSSHAREPVRYDLFDGELPSGLTLDDMGHITGVPIGAGPYTFEVLLVDMDANWVVQELIIEVVHEEGEVFVGPVLAADDLNGLCLEGFRVGGEDRHLMCQPWVRIEGAGMPGQSERTVEAGLFWVGGNGIADGGWFDDALIRTLPSDTLEWTFEPGEFQPEEAAEGVNSPTDGDVTEGGVLVAGELTGPGWIHASSVDHGSHAIEVLVVPPDFCPAPGGC
jgi:hypothetical protein